MYHSSRFSGHLGRFKTTETLKRRFYWVGMDSEIETYVKKCFTCKLHKTPLHKKPGHLQPINPSKSMSNLTPGSFLSSDLLGPFPVSAKGNRMIIVVTDLLTRYVICGALKGGTAEEVAEFLVNNVICIFGLFRVLLTDNGKCYQSRLMGELGTLLGFRQIFTTPYGANINGLTERFNKTLAQILSSYIGETSFLNWDANIPSAVFAHNTSTQATLKQVPFFLMFGRNPTLPQDIALNLPSPSLTAETMAKRLSSAFAKSKVNLEASQE
jgi:transposase InsO family protein